MKLSSADFSLLADLSGLAESESACRKPQQSLTACHAVQTGSRFQTLQGHGHWVNTLALSAEYALRTGPFDHTGNALADPEEARQVTAAHFAKTPFLHISWCWLSAACSSAVGRTYSIQYLGPAPADCRSSSGDALLREHTVMQANVLLCIKDHPEIVHSASGFQGWTCFWLHHVPVRAQAQQERQEKKKKSLCHQAIITGA